MSMTDGLRSQTGSGPVYFEEPKLARWLFGSSSAAWIWLIARLWLGWEWFQAGWGKVFGGTLTWRFWNWGDSAYSLGGSGNIGWIRSGTVGGQSLQVGDSVAGFAKGALASGTQGAHPDVAYSWYVSFLEWVRDSGHVVLGPLVAIGELTIGILLILGLFTGIVAFLGAILNFSFVFAGSAGINPAMIVVGMLLVLAWRNAGWYGLDRVALPRLGTPWQAGALFHQTYTRPRPPTVGGTIGQT
ncbi:MAG TPA: DoxX family protein [Actinomycetes bacterium]|jgi:thiosulfate dehydrogenase [quinone] large subunit|nr:DoxX family protein [Actinomycetes bacterium]